jgi:hypothetical protein
VSKFQEFFFSETTSSDSVDDFEILKSKIYCLNCLSFFYSYFQFQDDYFSEFVSYFSQSLDTYCVNTTFCFVHKQVRIYILSPFSLCNVLLFRNTCFIFTNVFYNSRYSFVAGGFAFIDFDIRTCST